LSIRSQPQAIRCVKLYNYARNGKSKRINNDISTLHTRDDMFVIKW